MRPLSDSEKASLVSAFETTCDIVARQWDEYADTGKLPEPGSFDLIQAADALRIIATVLKAAIGRPLDFEQLDPNKIGWVTPWLVIRPAKERRRARVAVFFGRRGEGAVAGAQAYRRGAGGVRYPIDRVRRDPDHTIDATPLGSVRTEHNNSFFNPAEFYRRRFDPQAFVRHVEESLDLLSQLSATVDGAGRRGGRGDEPPGGGRGGLGAGIEGIFGSGSDGPAGWRPGESWVSDLSPDEFQILLGDRSYEEPDESSHGGRGPCADATARTFVALIDDMLLTRSVIGISDVDWKSDEYEHIGREYRRHRLWPGRDQPPGCIEARERAREQLDALQSQRRQLIQGTLNKPPGSVDWRNNNGVNRVPPIRNQGLCGSCVAFATVATIESMLLIERDTTLDLSEAELFSEGGGSCVHGWQPSKALDYVREKGIGHEHSLPYHARDVGQKPGLRRSQQAITFTRCIRLVAPEHRKAYLALVGPVIGSMLVHGDFQNYGSGVYGRPGGEIMGGHSVQIVGYDDDQQCWIGRNSWGTDWGEAGYFRIAYGECGMDSPQQPFWGISGVVWRAEMVLPPLARRHLW